MTGPVGSDTFAAAPVIAIGETSAATPSAGLTTDTWESNAKSAWWKFTPDHDMLITADLLGTVPSSADTTLEIYDHADPSDGLYLFRNDDDDFDGGYLSRISSATVLGGHTYLVRAAMYSSSETGDFVLSVQPAPTVYGPMIMADGSFPPVHFHMVASPSQALWAATIVDSDSGYIGTVWIGKRDPETGRFSTVTTVPVDTVYRTFFGHVFLDDSTLMIAQGLNTNPDLTIVSIASDGTPTVTTKTSPFTGGSQWQPSTYFVSSPLDCFKKVGSTYRVPGIWYPAGWDGSPGSTKVQIVSFDLTAGVPSALTATDTGITGMNAVRYTTDGELGVAQGASPYGVKVYADAPGYADLGGSGTFPALAGATNETHTQMWVGSTVWLAGSRTAADLASGVLFVAGFSAKTGAVSASVDLTGAPMATSPSNGIVYDCYVDPSDPHRLMLFWVVSQSDGTLHSHLVQVDVTSGTPVLESVLALNDGHWFGTPENRNSVFPNRTHSAVLGGDTPTGLIWFRAPADYPVSASRYRQPWFYTPTALTPPAPTPLLVPHHDAAVFRYIAASGAAETSFLLHGLSDDEPFADVHKDAYAIPAQETPGNRYVSMQFNLTAPEQAWAQIYARWYRWDDTAGALVEATTDQIGPAIQYGGLPDGAEDLILPWTTSNLRVRVPDPTATHWRPKVVFSATDPSTAVTPLAAGTEAYVECLYIPDNGRAVDNEPYLDGDQSYGIWEGERHRSSSIFGTKPPALVLGPALVPGHSEAP